MNIKYALLAITFSVFALGCSNTSDQTQEETKTEVPADKEIKMEDVDDQLKTDQERADSIKRELGIE